MKPHLWFSQGSWVCWRTNDPFRWAEGKTPSEALALFLHKCL